MTPAGNKPENAQDAAVSVQRIVKTFASGRDTVTALNDVRLSTSRNEFFTLLGPSGCGKTTLLRIIAGFEEPTSGEILLQGENIRQLPPNQRPVNTVFQHYALFPHMTVRENVAFGLKRLKQQQTSVNKRADEMLELVQLSDFAGRMPGQLSGGQQQRVALARALAPHPRVLLLDEPLSALDLKLRQAMRVELKQLQQDTGITFIFVTHDQEEALTMSDRIAVMSDGQVQQIGTPTEIYDTPVNRFVADFIGDTNLLDVTVVSNDAGSNTGGDSVLCQTDDGVSLMCTPVATVTPGHRGHVSIRPEKITPVSVSDHTAQFICTVDRTIYLGTDTLHVVHLKDGTAITVRSQNAHGSDVLFQTGDQIGLRIDAGAARLLTD